MKQTTKITVEYNVKDVEEILRDKLNLEGFKLERIEPQFSVIGGDRNEITNTVLKGIVCHVTAKPPYVPGPYGDR